MLDALLQVANRTLKKMTTEEEFKPFIPALSAISSAAAVAFEGFGPAAAPISNYVKDVVSMAAGKRERHWMNFYRWCAKHFKNLQLFVVDEATLALKGEARSQVSFGLDNKMDKARHAVERSPISSEFGCPFRQSHCHRRSARVRHAKDAER